MSHTMHRKPSIAYWLTGKKSREAWLEMIELDIRFEEIRREVIACSAKQKPAHKREVRHDEVLAVLVAGGNR